MWKLDTMDAGSAPYAPIEMSLHITNTASLRWCPLGCLCPVPRHGALLSSRMWAEKVQNRL